MAARIAASHHSSLITASLLTFLARLGLLKASRSHGVGVSHVSHVRVMLMIRGFMHHVILSCHEMFIFSFQSGQSEAEATRSRGLKKKESADKDDNDHWQQSAIININGINGITGISRLSRSCTMTRIIYHHAHLHATCD